MGPDLSFQQPMPVGRSNQRRQMPTGGRAGNRDPAGVVSVIVGVSSQEADGCFDVVHLGWEGRDR